MAPGGLRLWADAGDDSIRSLPGERLLPVWSQPVHAHLGGPAGDWTDARWWWLGVHGGAGVTTVREWIPGGADAHRLWPDPAFGGPGVVVLVCRAHVAGLARARDAAHQWAARQVPDGLLLGGLVIVADAPGRGSRAQTEASRLLAGAVPRLWRVPWVEQLRALTATEAGRPPALGQLAADLAVLAQIRLHPAPAGPDPALGGAR